MTMHRLLQLGIGVAIFAALWGAAPGHAHACSCLPATVESSYNTTSDVVSAQITFTWTTASARRYLARVDRTFKGCAEPGQWLVLTTSLSSASCGVELDVGVDYLINGRDAGTQFGLRRLSIGLCDYNVRVSSLGADDRAFLDGRTVCCGDACTCADGSQPVQCFVDPCQVAPACDAGQCVANYCGGCNAEFYSDLGYPVCEPPQSCTQDADCPDGRWCREAAPEHNPDPNTTAYECVPFKGYGGSCEGFTLPYLYERCDPGLVCDTPDFIADAPGTCRSECTENSECGDSQYCAADHICDGDSRCERDVDCNLPGNDYPHIECVGHGVCDLGTCGFECGNPQCLDLGGYDFGLCRRILGWAVRDGSCALIGGCSAGPFELFESRRACERACGARR